MSCNHGDYKRVPATFHRLPGCLGPEQYDGDAVACGYCGFLFISHPSGYVVRVERVEP